MSSRRRLLSSQANGRLSLGPVTVPGKRKSSQNALSHGLTAEHLVLVDESPAAFQEMLDRHAARLRPRDGMEADLIQDMVCERWRLQRARAIEGRMLDDAAAESTAPPEDSLGRITGAFNTLNHSGALPLLHRYESRLHTMYQRSLQNLMLLRALEQNEPSPNSGQRALPPPEPSTGGNA